MERKNNRPNTISRSKTEELTRWGCNLVTQKIQKNRMFGGKDDKMPSKYPKEDV